MSTLNYREVERKLASLGINRRPVAVKYLDEAPAGVEKFEGTAPSGCSFWRMAQEGRVFYTVPADHYNCPIGSYTHNIPLPPERAQEMERTLGLMVNIGYLRNEEVPGMPRLPRTPAAILYAPLGDTPVDPDAVLFAGRPGRIMLLQEAAVRAGVLPQFPAMGRPTCMALPAAIGAGGAMSTGCVGNRIYAELGDDELYVVIRGQEIERVADEAATIVAANAALVGYHTERKQALTSLALSGLAPQS